MKKLPDLIDSRASDWSPLTSEPSLWYDRLAVRVADYCSPILVKECRQALSSRQFFWTFVLLLVVLVFWSFMGVSQAISSGANDAGGPELLGGYLVILAVPLGIVVPFGCFRSLAREYEDETIQLMTITTMSPYRIINGKLASACLQLLIYFSAVAPCVAFTFLLRGVDLNQIVMGLVTTLVGSVSLCSAALMLGGLARSLFFRVIIHMAVAAGLILVFCLWFFVVMEGLVRGEMFREPRWFSVFAIFLTWTASIGWVCYHAAASQISFAADNRSSKIRKALMFQHCLFMATLICPCLLFGPPFQSGGWAMMLAVASAHYWLLIGSMTCAENTGMSSRVRRELPWTWPGQSFRGLLMPGPGRGYLFALANLWGWMFVTFGTMGFLSIVAFNWQSGEPQLGNLNYDFQFSGDPLMALATMALNACHASIFLSMVYLVLTIARRRTRLHPLVGLVVLGFVLVAVHVGTFSLHIFMLRNDFLQRSDDFSIFLSGNWWLWLSEVMDRLPNWEGFLAINGGAAVGSLVGIASFALVTISVIFASRELVTPPASIPERVLKEMESRRASRRVNQESIEDIFKGRDKAQLPQ